MSGAAPGQTFGSLAAPGVFEQATGRLMPALRGYGHRLTRDSTQTDDLVQETLLRAWAARHRFIPDSNLKAWLFRIEYNCFVSILRKTRRIVQLSPEMEQTRLIAPAAQEEGLMMRDLDAALASLPSEQATAFALINDEGLRYEEAAERLGVPLGTMKSRTARARAAVRRFLAGDAAKPSAVPMRRLVAPEDRHQRRIDDQPGDNQPGRIDAVPGPEMAALRAASERYAAWKASGRRTIG